MTTLLSNSPSRRQRRSANVSRTIGLSQERLPVSSQAPASGSALGEAKVAEEQEGRAETWAGERRFEIFHPEVMTNLDYKLESRLCLIAELAHRDTQVLEQHFFLHQRRNHRRSAFTLSRSH